MKDLTWHVWTDGSCLHGPTREERAQAPKGLRGAGGWAAIIWHGSDGSVLRGAVPQTTNVRMELVAVIEGLRSLPGIHQPVILHTDATTVVSVRHAWERDSDAGTVDLARWRPKNADADLWRQLAPLLARHDVIIDLLERGVRPNEHKRAHAIAGAEARALIASQGVTVFDLPPSRKARRRARKKVLAAALAPPVTGLVHKRDCTYESCVASCPILQDRSGDVYESRRRSEQRRIV